MEAQMRRTWASVSLDNLANNYHALRGLLPEKCKFMGMVKSNAYGHGAIPVARELEALGAEYLGVACLDEAVELRAAGVQIPILILGATAVEDLPQLLAHRLTQSIFDGQTARAFAQAARALGATLTVHIKVDTGMARLGFYCDENRVIQTAEEIAEICTMTGLHGEGIFTHFADADGDEAYTLRQMTCFLSLLDKLEQQGHRFALRHAANSAATICYPFSHLDMVRPGLALYGHYPEPEMASLCPLTPVMELRSRISALRHLPKGSSISYGRTHVLKRDSCLAVIPIGYGDGFFRGLSNVFSLGLRGALVPIVGRICMDMCMVDVTDVEQVTLGEELVIYARDNVDGSTWEEAATQLDTISYELLCALSKRIPRMYEGGEFRTLPPGVT